MSRVAIKPYKETTISTDSFQRAISCFWIRTEYTKQFTGNQSTPAVYSPLTSLFPCRYDVTWLFHGCRPRRPCRDKVACLSLDPRRLGNARSGRRSPGENGARRGSHCLLYSPPLKKDKMQIVTFCHC